MKDILIINSAPFTQEFVDPIINLFKEEGINFRLVDYDKIPEEKNNFSGVIISASPKGDDIIEKQLPFYQWIKNYSKPIIGSCHGHQLLGVLFGSKVIMGKEAEEGIYPVQVMKNDVLFEDLMTIFKVEQHHIKSITLPISFNLLASSGQCKNQIMKHNYKPIYGCQFHLEKSLELLLNFVKICNRVNIPKVLI